MTELAIATGIIQVAGAGVALTKALYNFGATTSSAGEQTDFIGKNISLYCRVLNTLGQQLKVKQPNHTTEALDLAQELQEQSDILFQKIRELLPSPDRDRSGLTLTRRILWNFRRNRVDYLVGQLEYLKSTVNLLLNVLSSVPRLRRHRRSKTKSARETEEIKETLDDLQNLIYERCQAQRQLPVLADKAESDNKALLPSTTSTELITMDTIEVNRQMIRTTGLALRKIDAFAAALSGSDDRIIILNQTRPWAQQLYSQWTTLSANICEDVSELFDTDPVIHSSAEEVENALPKGSTSKVSRPVRIDLASDGLKSQREKLSITFTDGPHQGSEVREKCNCIRAELALPSTDSLPNDLRLLDEEASESLWLCYSHLYHPTTFIQTTGRRKELRHKYHTQYLLPLYQKYLARLENLLATSDNEIADLYRQRGERGISQQSQKAITELQIPPLFQRRRCLSALLKKPEFNIQVGELGSIAIEPVSCLQVDLIIQQQSDKTTYSSGSELGANLLEVRRLAAPAWKAECLAQWGSASESEAVETGRFESRAEGVREEGRREYKFPKHSKDPLSPFKEAAMRFPSRNIEISGERKRPNIETSDSTKSGKSGWNTGVISLTKKNIRKVEADARQGRRRAQVSKEQEQRRDRSDKANRSVDVEDCPSSDSDRM